VWLWLVVVPATALVTAVAAQQPTPTFHAGVELVTIDVQIAPTKDAPMRGMTAADFEIIISGRQRPAGSVTLLHFDEGKVARRSPECVFGFHRKNDPTTAHYLISVERTAADQKEVKQVKVTTVDKGFAVQSYAWRSPVRVPS
jgi:hypothetical protein